MPSDAVKFTLRTEPELLKKFRFVAEYNARSCLLYTSDAADD